MKERKEVSNTKREVVPANETHSVVELLIGILVIRASPHLELHSILCRAASDIQALVSVNLDASTFEAPVLGFVASAWLDDSRSTICVLGGQTEGYMHASLANAIGLYNSNTYHCSRQVGSAPHQ